VHCCVTSPPYWGLRDYGNGANGIGLEGTPDEWCSALVGVFREVRRVLRPDGTCFVNIGDTYYTAPNGSLDTRSALTGSHVGREQYRKARASRRRDRAEVPESHNAVAGLKPKDLIGLPWMLAFALRGDGWFLRSDIIWSKPNAMPESVTDRPTCAHEHVFLLAKSARYYYDAEAVKEPCTSGPSDVRKMVECLDRIGGKHKALADPVNKANTQTAIGRRRGVGDPAGRSLRNVWTIGSEPYPEAHFATFPTRLVKPCVLAGTSERGVCPACGAPWRRVVQYDEASPVSRGTYDLGRPDGGVSPCNTGWEPGCTCGHGETVPATVLDPFGGSGTTALVALLLGRIAVLCELNPDYAEMARERCAAAAAQATLF
jgi:DNA modification methylase